MAKSLISDPILARSAHIWHRNFFSWSLSLLDVRNCCKLLSYHRMQEKSMIQTQENGKKPHPGPDLGSLVPNSGRQFFFKNLVSSVTRYHGQLSSCSNDPILRKFSDGPTDRWTNRQTEVIS